MRDVVNAYITALCPIVINGGWVMEIHVQTPQTQGTLTTPMDSFLPFMDLYNLSTLPRNPLPCRLELEVEEDSVNVVAILGLLEDSVRWEFPKAVDEPEEDECDDL